MSTDAALVILGVFCAGIGGWVYLASRLNPPQRGRHEFADPADITDPDGAAFIGQLKGDGRLPYDEDWWQQEAPAGAVEVLTGPGTKIAATSQLVTTVMARVQDAIPGVPGDDPCDTGEFAALLARGRVTPAQEADRLASKYLTAPAVTP